MATTEEQSEATVEYMKAQALALTYPTYMDIAHLAMSRLNDKTSGASKTSPTALQYAFDDAVTIIRKSIEFRTTDNWWLESPPAVSAPVVDARNQ